MKLGDIRSRLGVRGIGMTPGMNASSPMLEKPAQLWLKLTLADVAYSSRGGNTLSLSKISYLSW